MRPPYPSDFEKMAALARTAGARQPSYPDRARIDSDVRYLLRPPSTPWITFDKDEPQIGALLASARSSVSSEAGFFPEAPVAAEPAVPPVEPSNVVVSTDITDAPSGAAPIAASADLDETHDALAVPVASPRRLVTAVACTVGLALAIAGSAWSLGGRPATAAAAASAPPGSHAETSSAAAEPASPRLDLPAPPPTSEPAEVAPPKPEKKGFGRLSVRGAAKHNRVYLDGKLLLGQGQRTFMVFCGDHTIAVGNKAAARDVDVPCNGELVVSK
jgi:hypothetical protein